MPRIRTIKPEFWDSPDTISASLRARLLYIAMWGWADDYGIGDGNLGRLINYAFPGDDIPASDFPTLASEVQRSFAVRFYTYLGRPYYWIPTWENHQRTEKKAKQRIPYPDDCKDCPDQGREPSAASVGDSDANRGSSAPGTRGTGEQGNLEQGNRGTAAHDADAPPALVILPTGPTFDDFWNTYPRHDDKPAARRAWAKAAKTTNPQTILDGATRYRDDPNRIDQFTKHPGTWLNAEAWNNDPLPTRTSSNGRESSLDRIERQARETFTALAGIEQKAIGQ